jgi:hypothetical protein
MEDECEGKWKAKTIIRNFENWSDPNLGQNPKPQPTPEEVFRNLSPPCGCRKGNIFSRGFLKK